MAKTKDDASLDDGSTDDTPTDVVTAESFTLTVDRNHDAIAQLDFKAFDAAGTQYKHLVRKPSADLTLATDILTAMIASWPDPKRFKFRFKVSGGVRQITEIL